MSGCFLHLCIKSSFGSMTAPRRPRPLPGRRARDENAPNHEDPRANIVSDSRVCTSMASNNANRSVSQPARAEAFPDASVRSIGGLPVR